LQFRLPSVASHCPSILYTESTGEQGGCTPLQKALHFPIKLRCKTLCVHHGQWQKKKAREGEEGGSSEPFLLTIPFVPLPLRMLLLAQPVVLALVQVLLHQ